MTRTDAARVSDLPRINDCTWSVNPNGGFTLTASNPRSAIDPSDIHTSPRMDALYFLLGYRKHLKQVVKQQRISEPVFVRLDFEPRDVQAALEANFSSRYGFRAAL